MRVYVINLDRHPQRMARMEAILQGADFVRVRAVDGASLDGPEARVGSAPDRFETMTRYERACVASHAAAWRLFLDSGARHACILEDDVVLSPDFAQFMADPDWVPNDCDVMKIETSQGRVFVERVPRVCRDRTAGHLFSSHGGSAGYVVSRAGAGVLLPHATRPMRPVDDLIFTVPRVIEGLRVRQIVPALCIQARRLTAGSDSYESQSSINVRATPPQQRGWLGVTWWDLTRPARRWKAWLRPLIHGAPLRAQRRVVPFR